MRKRRNAHAAKRTALAALAFMLALAAPEKARATTAERYDIGFIPYEGAYVNNLYEPIPWAAARGVDVSVYQGEIDWAAVAQDDVSFAFIRCGASSSGKDEMFDRNAEGANMNGIAVGVYYRTLAVNEEMAEIEAMFAVKCASEHLVELPIAMDIEGPTMASLGRERLRAVIDAFCGTVEAYGYEPMVYASKSFFENHIGDDIPYMKWVAQYAEQCTYQGGNVHCWQCTSHGCVRGIEGRVDVDLVVDPEAWGYGG